MHDEHAHLEKIGDFYAKGDYMDELLARREVELLRKHARTWSNALEVGCGYGYVTEEAVKLFEHYEVVEPSAKNLETMRKRVPRPIRCHQSLLEDYQTDRLWDNILFMNVVEHVEDPIAALSQLEKLLRDEGLLFVSAPNCMSLNRRAGFHMGLLPRYDQFAPKDYELGHRRLYTVDMLREHCEAAGLKVLAMAGVYLKPLAESQMVALGDAAVRAFYALGEDVPQYCANLLAVTTRKHYST